MTLAPDHRPIYIQHDVRRLTIIREFRADTAVELGTARMDVDVSKIDELERDLKALDKIIQDFSDHLGPFDYPLNPDQR